MSDSSETWFDDLEFVGPFESHEVVLRGWSVPFLDATPLPGGRVYISLDRRFGLELALADAQRVVPFIADCIAIALGYTAHPERGSSEPKRRHPMARVRRLDLPEGGVA